MRLLLMLLLCVPGLVLAQGPAGDPRDNLDHPGSPTDRYLDAAEIRDVMHATNDAFYGCYRTHVRGTKEAGEVAVRFTVTREGTVTDAAAEMDGAPPSLGPCLVDVLSALQFASHDGDPVQVSYPLVYQVDRKGARVLPYPVVFTKPRRVRLPLLVLPATISAGELAMLERILVDPDERIDADRRELDQAPDEPAAVPTESAEGDAPAPEAPAER